MAKHIKPVKLGSPFPKGYKSTWWRPTTGFGPNGRHVSRNLTDWNKPCGCETCRVKKEEANASRSDA
jgi:hypothetical protein